jgi:GntR family transcriptional regulator
MLDEKAPVTLYYQLKEIIINKIKSKEWAVDIRIPTERQLCDIYKVSRITVRQALAEIEREGFLYRKQGKGTFVTIPKLEQRLSSFYSFSEEISKMGFLPGSKMLNFSTSKADDILAKNLNIGAGSAVYIIKRLRLADNEPFAFETSYMPYDMLKELSEDDITSQGLYNTLKHKYDINPDEAVETFEAVIINSEDAQSLNVKKNSPGLLLERFTYAGGKPVEYCRSIIRGDRYKYKVVLKG